MTFLVESIIQFLLLPYRVIKAMKTAYQQFTQSLAKPRPLGLL
jgi:hypothetical protein